jgi:hypothetical protein
VTELDSLIDAAAREMTAAPSRIDLRAKVIEEIRAGGTSLQAGQRDDAGRHDDANASYHRLWWLAAAASILLALYVGWPAPQPVELPTAPPLARHKPHGIPATPPPFDAHRTATRARAAPAAIAVTSEPGIASIPALDAPGALGIAPLDTTPDPLPALDAVEPLDVQQLDIKPLTPPGPAAGGQ